MECGEQCVVITGITMMPEFCADNWGTVVEVRWFIWERIGDVDKNVTSMYGNRL